MQERTDTQWSRAASSWKKTKAAYDDAIYKLAKARKKLLELAEETSCHGSGVSATRYYKAGSVDYPSIPELKTINLDAYRKAGRWEWRVDERPS
jgi:hypothetical protein